jgi:hypothetical protein
MGIGAVAIGVAPGLPSSPVLALGGGLFAVAALVVQDRAARPVSVEFAEHDWTALPDGGLAVTVRHTRHGKQHPEVTVWERLADGRLDKVIADVHHCSDGDVVVRSGSRFAGRLDIR